MSLLKFVTQPVISHEETSNKKPIILYMGESKLKSVPTKDSSAKKLLYCFSCKATFHHFQDLKQHTNALCASKLHKCHKCKKSFTKLCFLKNHLKFNCDEITYSCTFCNRSFQSDQLLTNHVSEIHIQGIKSVPDTVENISINTEWTEQSTVEEILESILNDPKLDTVENIPECTISKSSEYNTVEKISECTILKSPKSVILEKISESCTSVSDSESKIMTKKKYKRKIHKCLQCDYTSNYIANVKRHMKAGCKRGRKKKLHYSNVKRKLSEYTTSRNSGSNAIRKKISEYTISRNLVSDVVEKKSENDASVLKSGSAISPKKKYKRKTYKCLQCDYTSNYTANIKRHMKAGCKKVRKRKLVSSNVAEEESASTILRSILTETVEEKSENYTNVTGEESACDILINLEGNAVEEISENYLVVTEGESASTILRSIECSTVEDKSENNVTVLNPEGDFVIEKKGGRKIHKCDHCDYTSNFFANVKRHMQGGCKTVCKKKLDYSQKIYVCEVCNYSSNSLSNVKRHISSKCNPLNVQSEKNKTRTEKRHKCEVCGYASNLISNVKRHMNAKHPENMEAQRENDVAKIMLEVSEINTERKHKCEICSYSSNLVSNVKRHMKAKHSLDF